MNSILNTYAKNSFTKQDWIKTWYFASLKGMLRTNDPRLFPFICAAVPYVFEPEPEPDGEDYTPYGISSFLLRRVTIDNNTMTTAATHTLNTEKVGVTLKANDTLWTVAYYNAAEDLENYLSISFPQGYYYYYVKDTFNREWISELFIIDLEQVDAPLVRLGDFSPLDFNDDFFKTLA